MKNVLVVDDDSGIRRSLTRILRSLGYTVYQAEDGAQAVEIAQQSAPDLLLLDIRMPGIDGVETFRRIRNDYPGVPAIFMTAYSASDRSTEACQAGAIEVVSKPLDLEKLVPMIAKAVEQAPILIVDDSEDFLRSLSRSLSTAGLACVTVQSFRDAIREIRKRPNRIVIADVLLPDGRGFELLSELRELQEQPCLILVTGHAEWFEQLNDDGGFSGSQVLCLAKPLDIEVLLQNLRDLQPNCTKGRDH